MDRAQKEELVAEMHGVFEEAGVVIVTQYKGLTVPEVSDLRDKVADAGASFKVTKNRLTKLALDGTTCEPIKDLFTGPTAIAYSSDPVAAPKVVADFAKANDKLVVIGGIMGDTVLDVDGVKALASLPSLDELRGKLVGLLQAPAGKIARVVSTPGGQIARVLQAYADKG
ncbi:MAG: 50S ribosomal protein L10 [Alphaproteobacteria bacterium]